jgi:D-lactate dehydrogenase
MQIAFFSAQPYERAIFNELLKEPQYEELEITYFESRLCLDTAVLAKGNPVVCAFVCDDLAAPVVDRLHTHDVRLLALRSAGFNHVDIKRCQQLGIQVTRVPAYSPHAVAEHTAGLLLSLNRKIHRAYQRVKELDFSLAGLVGFDIHGKTVGVVGTGKIGASFVRIMRGFGAHVLAFDPFPSDEIRAMHGVTYVELSELIQRSGIISLHCPLTPDTKHMINAQRIAQMRDGVMILNTSRGALIDTRALIHGLKLGKVGAAGLDVYEEEEGIFFSDLSESGIKDDVLARLITFPNVLITAHQAFLTREALRNIAERTLLSVKQFTQATIDSEARLA